MKKYLVVFTIVSLAGFLCGIYFVGTPNLRVYRFNYRNVHSDKQGRSEFKVPSGIQEIKIRARKKKWKRDPFSISPIEKFQGEIHLEAISMDAGGRGIAMVSGEFYREGDMLGAYKIKKISKDYIIVDEGGENIMMKLEKGD